MREVIYHQYAAYVALNFLSPLDPSERCQSLAQIFPGRFPAPYPWRKQRGRFARCGDPSDQAPRRHQTASVTWLEKAFPIPDFERFLPSNLAKPRRHSR